MIIPCQKLYVEVYHLLVNAVIAGVVIMHEYGTYI